MISNRLSLAAEAAAARYAMLTDAWRVLYDRALAAPDFGSAQRAAQTISQAYETAEIYLDSEREMAFRAVDEFASEAHTATVSALRSSDSAELTPSTLEHLSETERYLIDELIAQVHRDVATLRKSLQIAALTIATSARARRVPERLALVEFRIDKTIGLKFSFHDRQNRQWDSKKFVRGLWRHTLLSVYNETVLQVLADHGLERADVVNAKGRVATIAIAYSPEFDGYADVRDEYFHPNAENYLEPEHVQA